MEEEKKVLLADMLDMKNELLELKRNIIFVEDLLEQKNDDENKIDVKNSKFYEISKESLDDLEQKLQVGLEDFTFENCFDLYKNFKENIEVINSDLQLVNALIKVKSEPEILEYNMVRIDVSKQILSKILDNYDNLLEKLKADIK